MPDREETRKHKFLKRNKVLYFQIFEQNLSQNSSYNSANKSYISIWLEIVEENMAVILLPSWPTDTKILSYDRAECTEIT